MSEQLPFPYTESESPESRPHNWFILVLAPALGSLGFLGNELNEQEWVHLDPQDVYGFWPYPFSVFNNPIPF